VVQNEPKQAVHHYSLAASVFVNRMAVQMQAAAAEMATLGAHLADPDCGLSRGSRKYLLQMPVGTQSRLDARMAESQQRVRRCLAAVDEYRGLIAALHEKLGDCQEEVDAGFAEDDDGGEKIRKMVKETLRTQPKPAPDAGETTTGFGTTTVGFGAAPAEPVVTNVLTVKRKQPAAEPAPAAGSVCAAAVVEDDEEAQKKQRT
jgi:hypothetical protein